MSFSAGLKHKSSTGVERIQTLLTKGTAFTANILTQTCSTVTAHLITIQADKVERARPTSLHQWVTRGFFPCCVFLTHLAKDSHSCSAGQGDTFTCLFLLYLDIYVQVRSSSTSHPCTSLQIKILTSALDN